MTGTGGMATTGSMTGTGGMATTGSMTGTGGMATTGSMTGTGGSAGCLADGLLGPLGKDHLLIGASMDDSIATQAPFDLRYLYIAGGIFDGNDPCASCASGCTSNGVSCANSGPGCAWWGCWQWDQNPPGQYVRDFITKAQGDGQIPMFTYYTILQASGVQEGYDEVNIAASDQAFMRRYLADFRFLLQQISQSVAFVHIEPDFWGYAEHVSEDPHSTAAAVASANPMDCSTEENTIAGLGRCMVAMTRKYAPNSKVGLHASGWGTKIDVLTSGDPGLDVIGEADKLGTFLAAAGASNADFVTADASDRDAEYYQSIGQDRWWDETNMTVPNFHRAFDWSRALAEKVGRPILWWQVPVGNMSLPGGQNQWKDNRVDYFFAHMDELAGSHAAGVAYGAGDGNQTNPSTDGGDLVSKTQSYAAQGGQPPTCP
jgi:hypothetical protein